MRARLDVDLDAFAANLQRIRETVAPAQHMLVVKDDAYGHGLSMIVPRAVACGLGWFGTFDVSTALAVREAAGPAPRVLAWTIYDDTDIDDAVAGGIELGVGDDGLLDDVARRARATGSPARGHLKIDTGLHRNGIRPEGWAATVARARGYEAEGLLSLDGVWSHIAEASDEEDDAARAVFMQASAALEDAPVLRHLAASAAAFARPEFRFDLVRIGAFAYGIRPAGGPSDQALGIRPIATLVAEVVAVADGAAVVDVGSVDGLDSRLAGRLSAATPAGPREIVGIDAFTTRIRLWDGARLGDEVALLGGRAPSTATDAAELLGTIGEQILLRISPRVPRRYR